jgi:hypothetical protein
MSLATIKQFQFCLVVSSRLILHKGAIKNASHHERFGAEEESHPKADAEHGHATNSHRSHVSHVWKTFPRQNWSDQQLSCPPPNRRLVMPWSSSTRMDELPITLSHLGVDFTLYPHNTTTLLKPSLTLTHTHPHSPSTHPHMIHTLPPSHSHTPSTHPHTLPRTNTHPPRTLTLLTPSLALTHTLHAPSHCSHPPRTLAHTHIWTYTHTTETMLSPDIKCTRNSVQYLN